MTPSKQRNPGTDLREEWLARLGIDARALEDTAAARANRPSPDPTVEAAQLLRVVGLLDLTTLTDEDTDASVQALCAKALRPISEETIDALGEAMAVPSVAAVCVFDHFVPTARRALQGSGVLLAAVSGGFPTPLPTLSERLVRVRAAVTAGADEIDAVIDREKARSGDWPALYDEVRALRVACGEAHLKMILAAGDLGDLDVVARAGLVCCMAGADFIKTSTGRERVNATLPIGLAMATAIRSYVDRTGYAVGLKAAGGIRETGPALAWLHLAQEELGDAWATPTWFRIGASSLLSKIDSRLEVLVGDL